MVDIIKKIGKIFYHKWAKRILGIFFLFGISGIFLQNIGILNIPVVYAQNTDDSTNIDDKTPDTNQIDESFLKKKAILMSNLLKIVYIILWPLIALAGISLDNTLVYGSIFHLDVPLWKLWNIMKNFANFALGFMVLFSILKSIFAGFDQEKAIGGPMKIIKNALIAGILIQASWFLTAAVIDISTITTYAIGGLPLSVLGNGNSADDQMIADTPIMGVNTNLEYKDVLTKEDSFNIRYTYGENLPISTCKYQTFGDITYIVGKTHGNYNGANQVGKLDGDGLPMSYALGLCVYHNQDLVKFNDFEGTIYKVGESINNTDYQNALEKNINEAESDTNILNTYIEQGHFINTQDRGEGYGGDADEIGLKGGDKWLRMQPGTTLSKIISKGKGFSHALITIYSSFLGFANISDFDVAVKGAGGAWIEMLIKTIFAGALIIPLLMLAIVLLARIAYLRLIIAFSPLLILFWLFFKDSNALKEIEIPSIGDLMGIVFAPVVTVFVLSLSVIFMSVLNNTVNKNRDLFFQELNIQQTKGENNEAILQMKGELKTIIKGENSSGFGRGADLLSWLIINLFAIALIWTLLFVAIKANKIGKKVVEKTGIDGKWLMKALGTIPIIPMKGVDGKSHGVGVGSIMKTGGRLPDRLVTSMLDNQYQLTNDHFFNKKSEITAEKNREIKEYLNNNPNADISEAIEHSSLTGRNEEEYLEHLNNTTNGYNGIGRFDNPNFSTMDTNKTLYILNVNTNENLNYNPSADNIITNSDGKFYLTKYTNLAGNKVYALTKMEDDENINSDAFNARLNTTKEGIINNYKTKRIQAHPNANNNEINNAINDFKNQNNITISDNGD